MHQKKDPDTDDFIKNDSLATNDNALKKFGENYTFAPSSQDNNQ